MSDHCCNFGSCFGSHIRTPYISSLPRSGPPRRLSNSYASPLHPPLYRFLSGQCERTIAIWTNSLFTSVASVSVAWAVLIAGSHRKVQQLLRCYKSSSRSLISDLVIRSSTGAIESQARLQVMLSQIQIARIRTTTSALSSALAEESTEDGGDEGQNPGSLVISGSPTNGPSPAVQSLPSCLGEPVAVIQGSHVDALLPQILPLLFARSSTLRG